MYLLQLPDQKINNYYEEIRDNEKYIILEVYQFISISQRYSSNIVSC